MPLKMRKSTMTKRMSFFQQRIRICLLVAVLASCSTAFAGQSWDLIEDWNPPANPNGAWTYGDYDTNSFIKLPYSIVNGVGVYLPAGGVNSDGFIYHNETGSAEYGIASNGVALEADYGTPVARWTAPASGPYNITVVIGGTELVEGPGFGNNFAQFAGLNINMAGQKADSFTNNLMSWAFTNLWLIAGATVDAYVANPGYARGGSTQTIFHVDAVQAPVLAISYANNNAIVKWPISSSNSILQTSRDVSTAGWSNFNGPIATTNGIDSITISPPVGQLFFRLTSP